MRVLILSGENHGFDKSAAVIHEFLDSADDLEVRLDSDKDVLTPPRPCASSMSFSSAPGSPAP